MSAIQRLSVSSIRNLEAVDIKLVDGINVFYGANGAGKTSILEAVHVLATGRSFRSSRFDPVIKHDQEQAHLFVELSQSIAQIGLTRHRNKSHQLKLDGDNQRSWEGVARLLPVQVLDSNSFQLLEGGPQQRRQFLDWGVFHVEPRFISAWRDSKKSLAQRNLLLKQYPADNRHLAQIEVWSEALVNAAEIVDTARRHYFDELNRVFRSVYKRLCSATCAEVQLHYSRGWPDEIDLKEHLQNTLKGDLKYAATQSGPQRADIKVRLPEGNAADIFSRGQQKMLICAMKIAQGLLYQESQSARCIYLVDDLPAELDEENRGLVLEYLQEIGSQLFITAIDKAVIDEFPTLPADSFLATFHVERGIITA